MTTATTTLRDHLDAERDALLGGEIARLPELRAETAAALEALSGDPIPADVLADLQRRAAHNETLIDAAQRGLRAAIARLADCRRAAEGLTTYGADGRVTTVGRKSQKLERRA